MATVVNAVLINKNSAFPEQMKICGSKVWLAKMKSALSKLDGCPLDVPSAMEGRRTELASMDSHKAGRMRRHMRLPRSMGSRSFLPDGCLDLRL